MLADFMYIFDTLMHIKKEGKMKSFFSSIVILFLAFSFVGCEEKSDAEKAKESMKEAWQHTKDAVKNSTE